VGRPYSYFHDNTSDDKVSAILAMLIFTVAEIAVSWTPVNLINVRNLRQSGCLTKIVVTFVTILNPELRFLQPSVQVIGKRAPGISSTPYLAKILDYAAVFIF
jgi:hypothetical protein